MKLEKFVEINHNFEPVIVLSASSRLEELKNSFKSKVEKFGGYGHPKQLEIDGDNYIAYQGYARPIGASLPIPDQFIFAYYFGLENENIIIIARRFEKSSVGSRSAIKALSNIFRTKKRTIKNTLSLLDNLGKVEKSMKEASPAAGSHHEIDLYFSQVCNSVIEAVSDL